MFKQLKGFTLIELLVVIAIIGILATVVIVSVNSARVKARDARRFSDIDNLRTALELYMEQNNLYPPAGNSNLLKNIGDFSHFKTYMPNLPEDPNPGRNCWYRYFTTPDRLNYKLMIAMEKSSNSNDGGINKYWYEISNDLNKTQQLGRETALGQCNR